jgi:uncharacterized protein YndB with AHSA1/START domain
MTADPGVLTREVFIAAPPEIVFGFLIDPRLMAKWIGLSHELEPRPGGLFRVEVSRGNFARGRYVVVTPPTRVAFTWGWETANSELAMLPPEASLVEIDLEPRDGGSLLRLRHSRLPADAVPIHRERWSVHLDRLPSAVLDSA